MSQPEFEAHYAELKREIDALEADLADPKARKHFADVRQRIETLYETLRQNHLLLHTVLENSAASIYAKRKDGRYTYLNRGMEILCNVKREECLGKTDFDVFPAKIAEQYRSNDVTAMMSGNLSESEETSKMPAGERLLLSKKVPLISDSGEVEGICGISTDVTDLRRTELALREAVETLQRERDSKLLNFEAATASISHEVRQPLAAIATGSAAAIRFLEMTPPDLDESRAILDRIATDCRHANEVFESISALFQKVDQSRRPVDVNEIALDVLQSLHGQLKDHGIATEPELASDLPLIDGHPAQLRQVVFNLVHNAIEAMAPTTDRTRLLRVSTRPEGHDAIVVAVEDSGPGIDPGRLDDIFDAFVTTKATGMGLGLAICRMIVQRHGGRLSASSNGRTGARLQFVLPVGSADTTHAHNISPTPTLSRRRRA
jgi:PAS domain S-box-containing protein